LELLRFPLGGRPKAQTRDIARRLGLSVAAKPDSQDICFVPGGSYARVVEKLRPGAAEPGLIVDLEGRELGRHQGVIHYTIGQRRGLGIGGRDQPLYVVRLEPEAGRVVVGPQAALARDRVSLDAVNWLAGVCPPEGLACRIKLRSTQPAAPGRVFVHQHGRGQVDLETPQLGVSPGQAAVFYDGTRVLGGGWITDTKLARRAA
jgi:tRNA-specific 2-thiouridylase